MAAAQKVKDCLLLDKTYFLAFRRTRATLSHANVDAKRRHKANRLTPTGSRGRQNGYVVILVCLIACRQNSSRPAVTSRMTLRISVYGG